MELAGISIPEKGQGARDLRQGQGAGGKEEKGCHLGRKKVP